MSKNNNNSSNSSKSRGNSKQSDKNNKPKNRQQTNKGSNPKFTPDNGPDAPGRNPEELWNRHPDLTESAGKLAFAQALGAPMDYDAAGGNITNPTGAGFISEAITGLMNIKVGLTYGDAVDRAPALNIAARNSYTFIRHWNSGHTNYIASDLLQYYVAIDQAYALHSWLIRIYGTLLNYKVLNRYTPDDLLIAQGVDPSSFRSNMAQFRFMIDSWSLRLQSFLVPKTIGVFKRHYDFFANYYKDSENDQKAQIYMMTPAKIFAWNDAATSIAEHFYTVIDTRREYTMSSATSNSMILSALIPTPKALLTYSDLETAMNNILESLAITEDFNVISGDILKAYGIANTWTVPSITSNYVAEPVFNWEFLVQIHNMVVCPMPAIKVDASVTVATAIEFARQYTETALRPTEVMDPISNTSWITMSNVSLSPRILSQVSGAKVLDVPFKDPTPTDVMEATRLMVCLDNPRKLHQLCTAPGSSPNEMIAAKAIHYGTEIVVEVDTFTREFQHLTRNGDYIYNGLGQSPFYQGPGTNQAARYLAWARSADMFTLAPITYLYWDQTNSSYWIWDTTSVPIPELNWTGSMPLNCTNLIQGMICQPIGDLDNTTIISDSTLENLHTAAVLSVFNIPENATKA